MVKRKAHSLKLKNNTRYYFIILLKNNYSFNSEHKNTGFYILFTNILNFYKKAYIVVIINRFKNEITSF